MGLLCLGLQYKFSRVRSRMSQAKGTSIVPRAPPPLSAAGIATSERTTSLFHGFVHSFIFIVFAHCSIPSFWLCVSDQKKKQVGPNAIPRRNFCGGECPPIAELAFVICFLGPNLPSLKFSHTSKHTDHTSTYHLGFFGGIRFAAIFHTGFFLWRSISIV